MHDLYLYTPTFIPSQSLRMRINNSMLLESRVMQGARGGGPAGCALQRVHKAKCKSLKSRVECCSPAR